MTLGLRVLGRQTTQVKHCCHHVSRAHTINMTYHCCQPRSPGWNDVGQVSPPWSHCLPSPFCTVLLGRKSFCVAHTWVGNGAPLPEGSVSAWIIWNSCIGEICLLSLISFFLHLFIMVWAHGYLFSPSVYNPILLCCIAQIVPGLLTGSAVSTLGATPISFCEHFSTSWHCKMLQAHFAYLLPQS